MSRLHLLRVVVGLVSLLLLSACSSFEKEWRTAKAPAATAARKGDPFSGAWDGQWTSAKHQLPTGPAGGRLRCIFTKKSATQYQARFHANWLIFATGYEVDFATERRGNVLHFRGEQDLGAIFGGIYRYDGKVTPARFAARFIAKSDHGRFDMVPARDVRGD